MSGSGGGGGGGSDTPVLVCEDLVLKAQIASPKAVVVSKLGIGDVLTVAVQTIGGTAVVVLLAKSKLAGGLAAPNLSRLRERDDVSSDGHGCQRRSDKRHRRSGIGHGAC
jgi:hypothetical protein